MTNYIYKGYELEIMYSANLGLYEGHCYELDIYISDVSAGLLSSEFRKRVNQIVKGENQ
jgi:hypothetical protein